MNGPEPLVSVVVCTRNRAPDIARRLHSVVDAVRGASVPAELLVVDNGSTDDTLEVLASRFPTVRVVSESRPGASVARNVGVHNVSGRVVLFTDDDVEVPFDWVDRMARPLLDGEAEVVVGGIRVDDSLRRSWTTPWLLQMYADHPEPPIENPMVIGANFGALRSVLVDIPLDERLGLPPYEKAEDGFFGVQVLEAGLRIRGVPGTPVAHHFDPSRLDSGAIHRIMAASGRSSAYVWHHWAHGNAPLLPLKSVVFRMQRAVRLPWLRKHPSDRDLEIVQKIAFIDELRRIAGTPAIYPDPETRRRAASRDQM